METNSPVPIGLKIFAILYVIKNTVPVFIISLSKILDLNTTTPFFKEVLPSISTGAAKMVNVYDYSSQATTIPLVISIIILVVLFLLTTDRLRLRVIQNKGTFILLKVFVSLKLFMIIFKMVTGTGDQSGTWSAGIEWLLTIVLTISSIIYVFSSKALRKFFTVSN